MKFKRSCLIAVLLVACGAPFCDARADDGEEQVWTEAHFLAPLDKQRDWTLTFTTMLRATESASRLTDRRLGVGLSRQLNRHAALGAAMQFRRIGPSLSTSTRETRFAANATFQTPLGARVTLSNRHMLELRDNFPGRDVRLYRNRTQINFPAQIFKTEVTPFASAEFFYDFRLREWARTRAIVGLTRRLNESVTADVFFLRQIEGGGGRPGDLHAVGVNLRFSS